MQRARSSILNHSPTTRGTTILPLVVVVLIAISLFVLWLRNDGRTPTSAGGLPPDVHHHDPEGRRDPVALADTSVTTPIRTVVEAPVEVPVEERIEVHVSTRVALMPSSKPVPRIRVEVGYGTSFEEGDQVLGTGRTNDAGEAVISVPKRALDQVTLVGGARYWARVVEPGYQRRTNGTSRAPDGDPSRIVVIAFPGSRLAGRVLDMNGRPVEAHINAYGGLSNGLARNWLGTKSKPDGSFALLCNDASQVTLVANAEQVGTGVLQNIDLPREAGCEPLTIFVQGPGVVRGRVSDASGIPAAGLELFVVLAELEDPDGSPVLREPRRAEIELEGRGLSSHTLGTASDGTFEVTGLRDDRYVVRARTTQMWSYPILLTSAPVRADGTQLELVLSRPHIVVQIVDAKGAPWTEPLDVREREYRWDGASKPDQPDLVVSVARDSAHTFGRYEYLVEGRAIGASCYAFDVTADREYTVALSGMGLGFTSKNVLVPPGAGRVEVVLVATPVGGFGTLDVEPKLSDGSDPSGELVIRLEHPDSGFLIKEEEASSSQGRHVTLSVPEGAYKLVVEGSTFRGGFHGTVMTVRKMGRAEMSVVVRAGERTHVEPVLGVGARVQLKLEGQLDDADRAALEKGWNVWDLDEWASLVQLQLLAPGRWPTPVSFLWEMKGSSAAGTHERSEMPFGTDQLSELLPSGSYTLEARTRGGRIVTAPVVLVDGQTTAVTVRFPESR